MNYLNFRKWPYWIKGGMVVGILGALIFILFPDRFYGSEVPWYLGLFRTIAFGIFAPIALLFQIDFITEAANRYDVVIASVISCFSFFIVFFAVGALFTVIIKKVIKIGA